MKGVIFNLLEEVLVDHHGDEAWDRLIETLGVSGAYTSLGNYNDAEMMGLVSTGAAMLSVSDSELLRWFGRKAMPNMKRRFPVFFEKQVGARDFILSINGIIHPEVRKLYAGASCPHFTFRELNGGGLVVGYASPRQLCHLAHGFIEGVADSYGETITVEHAACMAHGDRRCELGVTWVQ